MNAMARAARRSMFRTGDRIEQIRDQARAYKHEPDRVELADARTSMCDYRCALANALGVPADRNGFAT